MGILKYGCYSEYEFDDRPLAHLQVVIVAKLRRHEGFLFCWTEGREHGGGRNCVWLDPHIPLSFRYQGGRTPTINFEWVDTLMKSANTAAGMVLFPEPE
ncbi:hypothetical protein [Cryobacterium psychrophilum]|uniref:DUF7882 domain-containing protein n=1 Tax=Cryobacterium psychrophilum TaxID=41988 RepID=A0A4Y8KR37_9MICO|nr:hypothetical protein [Cryobacterium psychrophilum]TFD80802.1 hypothetical protein E3T53_03995 [Cryobacterium psychrophilum]